MTIEQVSEEEFDYHLLFQSPENPTPEPDECNPWNAGAEQLQVHRPNGYVPSVFMQVDPDK